MSELRALIADDEANVRFYLRRHLEALWPDLRICAEATNGEEALQLIDECRPQVVFLDIRMPGLSGLEVAKRIEHDCQVVFVTAHDEFAVKAFEQAAVDYVLKPVSEERLLRTVQRLQSRLREATPGDAPALLRQLSELLTPANQPRFLRWIKAARRDEILVVSVDDVLYFESDEKYTKVVTVQDELLIRKSVKELETELDPERFWRVHRSIIVNVTHIERTQRDLRGHLSIQLRGGKRELPVSRSFAHRFKQM